MSTEYFDYCLKFDDEEQANVVLFSDSGEPKYLAIDVIGAIHQPAPSSNVGEEPTPPTSLPGWHVNVRHNNEAPELAQYQVFPATPRRVWA